MYTPPQLIALGFGAFLGAKAFAFALDSLANFLTGVIIGRLLADRFAFGPVRKHALAIVQHTDCFLCHETHHSAQLCAFYRNGVVPVRIPYDPSPPPPDPPDFGAAA